MSYYRRLAEAMRNVPYDSPYWRDTSYGRVFHYTEWVDNEFDPGRWAQPRKASVSLQRQRHRHGKRWRARCKKWRS